MKRQNIKGLIALAFSAALLTACATSPTLYGPQTLDEEIESEAGEVLAGLAKEGPLAELATAPKAAS